ncbi:MULTISPECIES: hypothetical protein [Microcystis]|uniref:Ribonuclease III n=1 Tax=Microcystis panniformis FACHB-1757 TaxID=1638788 RepID=A0A0K1RW54_9CHRO|nr:MULTISPECIES: hypothetical protein [Microcystis]AKV66008.1 Ribonuclease III [Microcystis panniformis FACHB-1757]
MKKIHQLPSGGGYQLSVISYQFTEKTPHTPHPTPYTLHPTSPLSHYPTSHTPNKLLNLCYDNSFGINLNRSRLSVCLVIEDRACALCVV